MNFRVKQFSPRHWNSDDHYSYETAVLVAVQNAFVSHPGVMATAAGLSRFGEHSLGWIGIAALGAISDPKRRKQWATAGLGALIAHAASVGIKRIVRRKRPIHPDIIVGVRTPSKLSFPSSHATSTAAATILFDRLIHSKGFIPALVVPPMMFSRLVLGVHYPTDVVAGVALGTAVACAVTKAEQAMSARIQGER